MSTLPFQRGLLIAIGFEYPCQCTAKAGYVRTAFNGIDIIYIRVDMLTIVVL